MQERDVNEQPSIYKREAREGGYTFVTCPDFPGFSFMLEPGEDDTAMNSAFVQFLAYDTPARAMTGRRAFFYIAAGLVVLFALLKTAERFA